MKELYKTLYKPNHPNSNTQGRIREHVYVASQALGKAIPKGTHIHHVNYDKMDNRNENLVICSSKYHTLIHARTDAYNATGDANKMKCAYCKQYDSPSNMYVRKNAYQAWHRDCANDYKGVENPQTGPYRHLKTRSSAYAASEKN